MTVTAAPEGSGDRRGEGDWRTGLRRLRRRPGYVIASLTMILIAAVGFLPGMLRALLAGRLPPDWIIHVHAAVYWLWLGLFLFQTVNAAMGRMGPHRRYGKFLIGYGVLMFAAGCGVTLNRIFKQIHAGRLDLARQMNLEPAVDMLVFPFLFALAVYYRKRKPELHKRLMIVTATALVYPAVSRMDNLFHLRSKALVLLIWSLPMLVGIVYDWLTRRRLHPVYVGGLLLFVVLSQRMRLVHGEIWSKVTSWLAT